MGHGTERGLLRRTLSTATGRRRRDLMEAAKLTINQSFESPPRLGDLAGSFGCSPLHLSRVFRETAGVSLRRYTQLLRVRVAADRLARGARNLTELALELGYTDHSHLTNAFRREWGLPPSRFRAGRSLGLTRARTFKRPLRGRS